MYRCAACGAFNRLAANAAATPICGRCKKDLDVSGAPQDGDAQSYARAIANSPIPVVVDFWAPWCGPCRMAAPILDGLGRELAGRVLFLKVNTDEHPQPSAQLGIRGIPTFIVFNDGHERARQSGVLPAPQLRQWLQRSALSNVA
ncbi:MAG: thioredoxin [Archangium sp.]